MPLTMMITNGFGSIAVVNRLILFVTFLVFAVFVIGGGGILSTAALQQNPRRRFADVLLIKRDLVNNYDNNNNDNSNHGDLCHLQGCSCKFELWTTINCTFNTSQVKLYLTPFGRSKKHKNRSNLGSN